MGLIGPSSPPRLMASNIADLRDPDYLDARRSVALGGAAAAPRAGAADATNLAEIPRGRRGSARRRQRRPEPHLRRPDALRQTRTARFPDARA